MKVMTILGTRPEIIRLSLLIKKLDIRCRHTLVHTGQNYDPRLSKIFFQELGVRAPDHNLAARGRTFGEQFSKIISRSETVMRSQKPDKVLILGDTNSGLSAIVAKKLRIPVYHMEAGNRCYDDVVPEEANRRIIDHTSDVLLPYTQNSRRNLLREGIPDGRIRVTGNPIYEVIRAYDPKINKSKALHSLGLEQGGYFLVTMHRAENVDSESRLRNLTAALSALHLAHRLPVIVSTHPRTQIRMRALGLRAKSKMIRFLEPFGFFDFIHLQRNAACVLSDSGTVQEECCIMRVPNVTLRDSTERPETVECGSNVLSGTDPGRVLKCTESALKESRKWTPPSEYLEKRVSDKVLSILLR